MHSDTATGYLKRTIDYLLQKGNFVYCGALAAVLITAQLLRDPALQGISLLLQSIMYVLLVLYACKMLDSMKRITLGLESEPVPMETVSVLPRSIVAQYLGGMTVYGALIYFCYLITPDEENRPLILYSGIFLIYIITPAVILSLFNGEGLGAVFNPSAWKRAINDIGSGRYLIAILLPFGIALVISALYSAIALVIPAVDTVGTPGYYLNAILRGLVRTLCLSLPWFYFAWYYPPPEETLDPNAIDFDDHELAQNIDMGDELLQQLTRLKAEEEKVAQLQRRQPPVDLTLLREANTEHMSVEEQRQFASDLMKADRLLLQGKEGEAEAVLESYADGTRDIHQYLPACKRLHHLYRRQKRQQELEQMEYRLIEASASGNTHSYPIIHATLDALPDGTLPAEWILPLAQAAAGRQHHDTVLTLTRNFAKHHPESPDIVDNYFLAARALSKKGEVLKAQQLLQQLLKRYPEHEKATQIRRTIELLQQRSNGTA